MRANERPFQGPSRHAIKEVLGEQDGGPEHELKEALESVFRKYPDVQRAFLVRLVLQGETSSRVILGIGGVIAEEEGLVRAIQGIFATRFACDQALEILFLSPGDEEKICSKAHHFYKKAKQA